MAGKDKEQKTLIDPNDIQAAIQAAIERGVKTASERTALELKKTEQQVQEERKKMSLDEKRAQARAEEDAKLGEMSRAEFGNVMFQRIVEALSDRLDTALKGVEEKFSNQFKEVSRLSVKDEITQAKDLPHFEKLKPGIAEVLKERPELPIADAYHIARGRNSEDFNKWETEARQEEAKANPPKRFGGLLPTSGVGIVKDEKMSEKAAADAAWNELTKGVDVTALFSSADVTSQLPN